MNHQELGKFKTNYYYAQIENIGGNSLIRES